MNEIRICPCCEGEGEVVKKGHGRLAATFSVRCKQCGLQTEFYESEELAIEKWNLRKLIERILKRLKESSFHRYDDGLEMITLKDITEIFGEESGL